MGLQHKALSADCYLTLAHFGGTPRGKSTISRLEALGSVFPLRRPLEVIRRFKMQPWASQGPLLAISQHDPSSSMVVYNSSLMMVARVETYSMKVLQFGSLEPSSLM